MGVVRQARLELSGGYTPDQFRPPPHTGRQAARMGSEAGTEGAPRGKGRGEREGQG